MFIFCHQSTGKKCNIITANKPHKNITKLHLGTRFKDQSKTIFSSIVQTYYKSILCFLMNILHTSLTMSLFIALKLTALQI